MTSSTNTTRAERSTRGEHCFLYASALKMGLSTFATPETPTSTTDPLGNLRKLPAEIRVKIWRDFMQNPHKYRPSSMALLLACKSICNEALPELHTDLEVAFCLDPENFLSVSFKERGGKLPTLDMQSVSIDKKHAMWKIAIQHVRKITFEILPPSTRDTAQLTNLGLTIDRLLDNLCTMWPKLPVVHITFQETETRKWSADAVWNQSYSSWPDARFDLTICAQFFLRLRNCETLKLQFEGDGTPPSQVVIIFDMIRKRATLSQAYGSNRLVDVSNPTSAMLPRTLAQWKSWERYKTANDHTIEQLLNIARDLLEESVDQVPGRMGDRLRISRFANWPKDYEIRNFDQLVGRNDDSSFGQLANTDYGNLYVKNFERRYAFMREFNPLSYANVAYDHERTSASKSCLTKLEWHVLEEKRDCFAASAWTNKYFSGFPSLEYWW